jgi:hypothetical protein
MQEVVAYKPDCCNKAMLSKKSALRHERSCPHNIRNRGCITCQYFEVESETYYNPVHYGNPGSTDYEYDIYLCILDPDNPVGTSKAKTLCGSWKQG